MVNRRERQTSVTSSRLNDSIFDWYRYYTVPQFRYPHMKLIRLSVMAVCIIFLAAAYSSAAVAAQPSTWEYGTMTFSELIGSAPNLMFSYVVNWDSPSGRAFHCQEHSETGNFEAWRLTCAKQMATTLQPAMEKAVPTDAINYEPIMLGFLGAMGWEVYATRVETDGTVGTSVTDYVYYLKRPH